ncbi:SDR family NAD(P)-dependent oxidoreductase [Nannocystis punicea]|uniref:SDR family NAD(P)-dependent oxidoreductase n=1 Tax=Nannocystis punicea TaxID=2995304 RepID=A0ABY7GVT8_9BACT|nr:SDR family NAD(P)-dependent oxidoreductase [Nannocystis poenicansa]WAS91030.1 SDR family NAD(P)-dependent oxidoreductase [Nannocystis poenicansa]
MLPDRLIVLTGATHGLGRVAALELARRGARLALVARDRDKAERTRAELRAAAPGASVDLHFADLTRLAEVRRVGEEIAAKHARIDVLINNAGVHGFAQRVTPDGLPEMIAVNYLAPWLLTRILLPALTAAGRARVVTVASEASRRHGTLSLPADLTDTRPFTARGSSAIYGKSKLLDIMFSLELARRLEATGVEAVCLDPGFNVTGLGRDLWFAAPLERVLRALKIGDPARGAGLIVELAVGTSIADRDGRYFTVKGRRALTPAPPGGDGALQRRLWAETEALLVRLGVW